MVSKSNVLTNSDQISANTDTNKVAGAIAVKTAVGLRTKLYKNATTLDPNIVTVSFCIVNGWDSNVTNVPSGCRGTFATLITTWIWPDSDRLIGERTQVLFWENRVAYRQYAASKWTEWVVIDQKQLIQNINDWFPYRSHLKMDDPVNIGSTHVFKNSNTNNDYGTVIQDYAENGTHVNFEIRQNGIYVNKIDKDGNSIAEKTICTF